MFTKELSFSYKFFHYNFSYSIFQVEDLVVVEEQLEVDVRSIETCPYSAATLADILSKIQHAVDDLSLRQYSNLHLWVQRLDEEVFISISCLQILKFIYFLSH